MRTFRIWSIGLVLGAAAALALPYTWALYGVPLVLAIGLAVTAAVLRPRPAGAAGVLIPVGAGWLLWLSRAAYQCAEQNLQPERLLADASCQMGDNSLLVVVGLLLLGCGVALTAFIILSPRRSSLHSRTQG